MSSHTPTISPDHVALIVQWAAQQKPIPHIQMTNFQPGIGADGLLIEFDQLTVGQAKELIELRFQISCHVSIGNQRNLDQVVFNRLFPYDKPMTY